ncbi:hypothetical protein MASR2M36_37120 [Providencia sp.]
MVIYGLRIVLITHQVDGVLYDPACYWGDRECDIAMLPLYKELPIQIIDGYQSVWPLPNGFLDRQPIYQLYYLINQAHIFGNEQSYQLARTIIDNLLNEK